MGRTIAEGTDIIRWYRQSRGGSRPACIPFPGLRGQRLYRGATAVATGLMMAALRACSSGPQPGTTASAFLVDWANQDWAGMRAAVPDPPADFAAVNQAAFGNLSVHRASFSAGTLDTSGSTANEPFAERLTLAGIGTITISSELHLVKSQGQGLIRWTPA